MTALGSRADHSKVLKLKLLVPQLREGFWLRKRETFVRGLPKIFGWHLEVPEFFHGWVGAITGYIWISTVTVTTSVLPLGRLALERDKGSDILHILSQL